jgi:peptidoglycan DL-endopeptidase CwlO
MSAPLQTVPAAATGASAHFSAGPDPAPAIAAAEHGLLHFLNTPTQQILSQLPLQRFPDAVPADPESPDAASPNPFDPTQVISPILDALGALGGLASGLGGLDPLGLIAPVVNAFGALGTGQFSGLDPRQVLGGVSNAFDRTASNLGDATGSVAHDWQGASGAAATAKTRTAVADGAAVATQADGLRDNLSTAAANVALARTKMVDIIDDYQATIAAIGPDVGTPAGRQAAVAAANQAVKNSSGVMSELQRTLGTQAEEVAAIGAPVQVTEEPKAAPPKPKPKPEPVKPAPDPALTVKLPDGTAVRAPNAVAANAVRNALRELGTPYRYGAKSPGVAFDCSGLTQWAYDKAGKDIPRVSRDQDVGASISRGDVQPGDLAVWNGHVAMIVGDGKMIEAGSPVELSPIRTSNEGMKFEGFYRPTA